MLRRIYVWEFPVRLTHWLFFLSIAALAFTGIYIGAPFIHPVGEGGLLMAWMRASHMMAAWVFTVAFLVRIYWFIVGDRYARLSGFWPTSRARWGELWETLKFYLFLGEKMPKDVGHAAIAGPSYLALFLLFLVEILTGFGLRSLEGPSRLNWIMGGWLRLYYSAGGIRLMHHLVMWVIILFFLIHMYSAWQAELVERSGALSSIFSGWKSVDSDE